MFVKLSERFTDIPYQQLGKQVSYGEAIEYFDVELNPLQVVKVIPPRYVRDFHIAVMKINQPIPPHTDSEIKTTINFYMQTEPCVTTFYEPNEAAPVSQIENQTNGVLFNKKDLKEWKSFIATPGEAWCLDVTKPHSVDPVTTMTDRVAITLATGKYNFEQVCNMLTETRSL